MSVKDKYREREQWVLSALTGEEQSVVDIAMKLETDCATVNAIIVRLESQGLASRRYDAVNRKNFWKLTSDGDKLSIPGRKLPRRRQSKYLGKHQFVVFSWLTYERRAVRRNICAVKGIGELQNILGINEIHLNENIVGFEKTQEQNEIEVALSHPGVIFQRVNDDIRAEFKMKTAIQNEI